MINIINNITCSGCSACAIVCKKKAINMIPDALGFLYPKIDKDLCVNCGLCDNVCKFYAPKEREDGWPKTYLLQHLEHDEVLKSKSGGAFVVLSDVILKHGGIVYGAKLNRNHLVEHGAARTPTERDQFRGSKYIQSNLNQIFLDVMQQLEAGETVLFSGTPCQIAGLKGIISERLSKKLYLIDILCHGVASPYIWKDYLNSIEKKKKKRIISCIPRNPKLGWDRCFDTFIFDDNKEYSSEFFTGYVYHQWITQRMSCKVCPFTSLNRISDISIGDSWGANKLNLSFDKLNIGGSLVLLNTAKGVELFEQAKSNAIVISVNIADLMQPVLKHPTAFHKKRHALEIAYTKHGYKFIRWKYLNNSVESCTKILRSCLSDLKKQIKTIKHVINNYNSCI